MSNTMINILLGITVGLLILGISPGIILLIMAAIFFALDKCGVI